jgi:hypothetical protein
MTKLERKLDKLEQKLANVEHQEAPNDQNEDAFFHQLSVV